MLLNTAEITAPFWERHWSQGRCTGVRTQVKHELVKIQIRIVLLGDKNDADWNVKIYMTNYLKRDTEDHFCGLEIDENIAYRENLSQRWTLSTLHVTCSPRSPNCFCLPLYVDLPEQLRKHSGQWWCQNGAFLPHSATDRLRHIALVVDELLHQSAWLRVCRKLP